MFRVSSVASRMSETITVDIWSDIACPWCYIGKRKLEAGIGLFLAQSDGEAKVETVYHSFELSPDTPGDFVGSEEDFLAQHKGLDPANVRIMLDQVTSIAASVGLDYNFDGVHHTNTVRAHELIHFAREQGKQLDMVESLFRAYFVDGKNLGSVDELADCAQSVGLNRADAVAALESERYLDSVREDQAQAVNLGINGVPFYVIDSRYGVSGAQDPAVFASALEQVLTDRLGASA